MSWEACQRTASARVGIQRQLHADHKSLATHVDVSVNAFPDLSSILSSSIKRRGALRKGSPSFSQRLTMVEQCLDNEFTGFVSDVNERKFGSTRTCNIQDLRLFFIKPDHQRDDG